MATAAAAGSNILICRYKIKGCYVHWFKLWPQVRKIHLEEEGIISSELYFSTLSWLGWCHPETFPVAIWNSIFNHIFFSVFNFRKQDVGFKCRSTVRGKKFFQIVICHLINNPRMSWQIHKEYQDETKHPTKNFISQI